MSVRFYWHQFDPPSPSNSSSNFYQFIFVVENLTLKVPEKLQLYGLYVYYVVHICDFGMLREDFLKGVNFDLLSYYDHQ